jgi:hypothetical protein
MSVIDTLQGAQQRLDVQPGATETELRAARDRARPRAIGVEEAAAIEFAYELLLDRQGELEELLHDEVPHLPPPDVGGASAGRGQTLGRLLSLLVSRTDLTLPEEPGPTG